MNELLKLLAHDKGTKGYRGTVLLCVVYIAWQVTSLKEEVGTLHTRVAIIEARLNFPGSADASGYGGRHRAKTEPTAPASDRPGASVGPEWPKRIAAGIIGEK